MQVEESASAPAADSPPPQASNATAADVSTPAEPGYAEMVAAAKVHLDAGKKAASEKVSQKDAAMIEASDAPADADAPPPKAGEGGQKKTVPPTSEDNLQRLARVIRERDAKYAQVRAQKEQAKALADAKAQADAARAEQQRYSEQMQRLEALKRGQDPIANARALGINTDEFTQAAAIEGSPEAKYRADALALRDWMAKQLEAKDARIAKLEGYVNQVEETRGAHTRAATEQAFVSGVTRDAYPELHALYGDEPQELVRRAYEVARQVSEATGGKKSCTDEEIRAYLNMQAKEKLAKLRGEPREEAPGKAAPGKKAGPRTLSAASASERRASPKPFEDMSAIEQDAYLRQVEREARKAHG